MRLKINNYTFEDVEPYLKLAAKHIHNVHRTVHVSVYYKRSYGFKGRAWPDLVKLYLPRPGRFSTFKRTHRFGQLMHSEANTFEELVVGLAAHEFAHTMKNGHKGRKVVKERFAEHKWMEAVEYYRTPAGQAFIASFEQKRAQRRENRAAKVAAKLAQRSAPETKRARLLSARKRWLTKQKRATTALKKLDRQIKRFERSLVVAVVKQHEREREQERDRDRNEDASQHFAF